MIRAYCNVEAFGCLDENQLRWDNQITIIHSHYYDIKIYDIKPGIIYDEKDFQAYSSLTMLEATLDYLWKIFADTLD